MIIRTNINFYEVHIFIFENVNHNSYIKFN